MTTYCPACGGTVNQNGVPADCGCPVVVNEFGALLLHDGPYCHLCGVKDTNLPTQVICQQCWGEDSVNGSEKTGRKAQGEQSER